MFFQPAPWWRWAWRQRGTDTSRESTPLERATYRLAILSITYVLLRDVFPKEAEQVASIAGEFFYWIIRGGY